MLTGAVAAALATILAWPSAASTLALADRLRHLATVGHNEPQLRRHGLTRQFADTTDKPATVLADSELNKDAPSKLTAVPGGEACCSTC
jgi:hypothetical protein